MTPAYILIGLLALSACAHDTGLPSSSGIPTGPGFDLYDARSNRIGYGVQQGDGSVDVFNMDGTRRATITPGIAGQPPRVTVPKGKR